MTAQPEPRRLDEEIQKANAERTAQEKLPVDQGNLPGSAVKGLDDARHTPVAGGQDQQNPQPKPEP